MLERMGYEFEIMRADIDEKAIRSDDPNELTFQLTNAKADALLARIPKPAFLITADQVIVWNGKIREKPENRDEAREFLRGYADHPAESVTAVCVTNTKTKHRECDVDIARVHFLKVPKSVIVSLSRSGMCFCAPEGFRSKTRCCSRM